MSILFRKKYTYISREKVEIDKYIFKNIVMQLIYWIYYYTKVKNMPST